jgi:hypothetical protein
LDRERLIRVALEAGAVFIVIGTGADPEIAIAELRFARAPLQPHVQTDMAQRCGKAGDLLQHTRFGRLRRGKQAGEGVVRPRVAYGYRGASAS